MEDQNLSIRRYLEVLKTLIFMQKWEVIYRTKMAQKTTQYQHRFRCGFFISRLIEPR